MHSTPIYNKENSSLKCQQCQGSKLHSRLAQNSETRFVVGFTHASEQPVEQVVSNLLGTVLNALSIVFIQSSHSQKILL